MANRSAPTGSIAVPIDARSKPGVILEKRKKTKISTGFVGYKNNQQAISDIKSGRLSFMTIDLAGAKGMNAFRDWSTTRG